MILFKRFRWGRAEGITLSIVVGLALLGFGLATMPGAAAGYERLTAAWTDLAVRYGYWGAFLSALVGSFTIVVIFPYTLIVLFLATQGLNPLALGVLMGAGAAIGEMSGYLIGMLGTRIVERRKPDTFDALQRIVAHRPNAILLLLFVFALTPLPDDVLFIPLGILRFSWWKVFLSTLVGKVLTGLLVTSFGFFFLSSVDTTTAAPWGAIMSQFGTLAALVLISYLFLQLDWQRLMRRLLGEHERTKE